MRKWDAVAVVLCLSGCASPGGSARQFRQAAPAYAPAPVRAPAPGRMVDIYRPVGTSLYGVGEAAPHGEGLPRSPNKRILPPTKEPGFWAADGAPTSAVKPSTVRLMEYSLPLPMASTGSTEPGIALFCVGHLQTILSDPTVRVASKMSSAAQQECLVAKMYRLCAETMRLSEPEPEQTAARGTDKVEDDDWRKLTEETAKVADAYKRAKCNPDTDTLAVRKFYALVHREWLRRQQGAVMPND